MHELIRARPSTTLVTLSSSGLQVNWGRFLHEGEKLDPLIRMAVGRYRIVAIHLSTNSSGRTRRILNLSFLVEQGLLDLPRLCLSRSINRHKTAYIVYCLP